MWLSISSAAATKATTAIPDPTLLSRALAENNDWRAMMVILVVVLVFMGGLMIYREISMARLHRSLDKVAESLWALKLTIAQEGLISHEDRQMNREDRHLNHEDRGLNREARSPSQDNPT